MVTVIVRGDWREIQGWLEENLGPVIRETTSHSFGPGWSLRFIMIEDPYAQMCIDVCFEVVIEDESSATLFLLRWT